MNFKEQIRKIRSDNNLTQEQLAAVLNVSRQTVSSWETGRNLPDLEMVVTIAKQFDLSLDHLILGGNEMTKKLIKDGSETRRARFNMISLISGALLLLIGAGCLIVKAVSVEYIDDSGILHENFFLLPVASLFILSSVLTFAVTGIRNIITVLSRKNRD
ncbi:MAG: DUF3955 domain-containing protein [Firmicutes bacterium]|nr:DUF3955 domain-containing protein [Bacillota bacterium]